jgi:hypothetical protein
VLEAMDESVLVLLGNILVMSPVDGDFVGLGEATGAGATMAGAGGS